MTAEATPTTVVMPCLNAASFIGAAVETVLRQAESGPDGHVQLWVVDGGSTDGTLGLLERAARESAGRVRYASRPDGGAAQALNEAFSRALQDPATEVLGWLNADDGYAPGAVARAVQALRAQPAWQLVYGHGLHVDAQGRALQPYPTGKPDKLREEGLAAWLHGSQFCQPTVFMRRQAVQSLVAEGSPTGTGARGLLDESLRTAFDYELWVRWLKRWPQGIGFIDEVQAYSRLHAGCLTLRMRETVALESMRVLATHIGQPGAPGTAPLHWALTHIDELCEADPFSGAEGPLAERVVAFAQRAAPLLTPQDRSALAERLRNDSRLRLAVQAPGVRVQVGVQPDGWASHHLAVRCAWRQPARLRLHCRGGWPVPGVLSVAIRNVASGEPQAFEVDARQSFVITLSTPAGQPEGNTTWWLETPQAFVPSASHPGSTDDRQLSFRVEGVAVEGG
jgi:hypothetical protein